MVGLHRQLDKLVKNFGSVLIGEQIAKFVFLQANYRLRINHTEALGLLLFDVRSLIEALDIVQVG